MPHPEIDATFPRPGPVKDWPGAGYLGEFGLGVQDVTAAVETASRARVMQLHRAVAVRALHHMRKRDRLMGAVRSGTGLGTLTLWYWHELSQQLS